MCRSSRRRCASSASAPPSRQEQAPLVIMRVDGARPGAGAGCSLPVPGCVWERTSMTPDQIADLRRQKYNATLAFLRKANSDLLVMRVRPDFRLPAHKPGQYTVLGLGNWEPRVPGCQEEALA